jgi:hypothetical protein
VGALQASAQAYGANLCTRALTQTVQVVGVPVVV